MVDSEKYEYPAKAIVESLRLLITNKLQPFLRVVRTLEPPPGSGPLLTNPMTRLADCCEKVCFVCVFACGMAVRAIPAPSDSPG